MDCEKAEVMRYLGGKGREIPPEIDMMAEECISVLRRSVKPRHVGAIFDAVCEKDGVLLYGTGVLLKGADIRGHLSGCRQAFVFAATLGAEADNLLRRAQTADITRALVLDSCCSVFIERFCDEIEEKARTEAAERGYGITTRYSPGYGDFSLEIQPKLLAVLDAERKIGLTCSETLIMLPRKSVTAVIGIGNGICGADSERGDCGSCKLCSMNKTCKYVRAR